MHVLVSAYFIASTPFDWSFRWKEYSIASVESLRDAIQHFVCGARHSSEQSSLFTRTAVLEARATKRFQLQTVAFFPFMFFVFGFIMGK